MSLNNHLHHCANCDQLFSAKPPLSATAQCPNCGKNPHAHEGGVAVNQSAAQSAKSSNMWVPGKDEADFVSMQRARRKMQRVYALAFWLLVLFGVVGVAIYNDQETDQRLSEQRASNEQMRQKERYRLRSIKDCVSLFSSFDAAATAEEASSYVYLGVQKILRMKSVRHSSAEIPMQKPYALQNGYYSDEGEREQVRLVVSDAKQKLYEAVYWKVDDQWKLDWDQHQRFNLNHWANFLSYKPSNEEVLFDLYLRRKSVQGANREMLIVAYLPQKELGVRDLASPAIRIPKGSDLYAELQEKFDAREEASDTVNLDGPGMLRARCLMIWEEGDDRNMELHLKSVLQYHWMSFEPAPE